jgi:serine phosphatase RsbU (regulator of sigma subunit)
MSADSLQVLFIEEDEGAAAAFSRLLNSEEALSYDVTFETSYVRSLREALKRLARWKYDVVLLDLRLSDAQGLNTLDRVFEEQPDACIVVLTDAPDLETSRHALRSGAQDFLNKHDLTPAQLVRSLLFAAERRAKRVALKRLEATQQEMEAAEAVQRMLLPKSAPQIPGLDIAGSYWPFDRVGGDYFDFFPLDGHLGLVIADVSGHGLASALVMAGLRRLVRSCVEIHTDAADTFAIANRAVWDDTQMQRFVTAFLGRLDIATRQLSYTSAGHRSYLVQRSGEVQILECDNPPLGVTYDAKPFLSNSVTLQPGDSLLLMTDGISEARNADGVMWGVDPILKVVQRQIEKPADDIIAQIYREVHAHCDPRPVGDDMAIIIVKVTSQ